MPRHLILPLMIAVTAPTLPAACAATPQGEVTTQTGAEVSIKTALPVLARHEGTWDGTFRRYDADGKLVAEFPSVITTEFPEDGADAYLQTNRVHPRR